MIYTGLFTEINKTKDVKLMNEFQQQLRVQLSFTDRKEKQWDQKS